MQINSVCMTEICRINRRVVSATPALLSLAREQVMWEDMRDMVAE